MDNNPYSGILSLISNVSSSNNSPSLQIGKVIAPPPEIQIAYNGIILEKEELWINSNLLVGYPRTAAGHIVSATQNRAGGSGDAQYESHNHDINNDFTDSWQYTDTLKVGEYVFVMPFFYGSDTQVYAILGQATKL
jgi:hypothetical protein